jgi:hypothetical protein
MDCRREKQGKSVASWPPGSPLFPSLFPFAILKTVLVRLGLYSEEIGMILALLTRP